MLDFSVDVEAIERATVAGVSPDSQEEIPGWLLPFDHGTIGRSHSAVPLRHGGAITADDVALVAARYRAKGLAPCFRVADVRGLAHLHEALLAGGFQSTQPTLTFAASVKEILATSRPIAVTVATVTDQPDAAWRQVYLGDDFDPVDGAHRVRALSRAAGSVYACSKEAGASQVVATGVGSFGFGWLGVHGMRTLSAYRGRGHASGILHSLARAAQQRGVSSAFLQVEEANVAAVRVYEKLGFRLCWRYHYWRANATH